MAAAPPAWPGGPSPGRGDPARAHSREERALRYCQLDALPHDFVATVLMACPHVDELDLTSNALTALPDDLDQLPQLRVLRVKYNKLAEVPPVCFRLPRCATLELAGNVLSIVPDGLAQLRSLRELDVSGNRITHCTSAPPQRGAICKRADLREEGPTIARMRFRHRTLPAAQARSRRCQSLRQSS